MTEKEEIVEIKQRHIRELVITDCDIDYIKIVHVNGKAILLNENYFQDLRLYSNMIEKMSTSQNVVDGKPEPTQI